jgi:hypothetical protein
MVRLVAYRLANWYVLLCFRVLLPTWCVFRQWLPYLRVHGGAMAQQPQRILSRRMTSKSLQPDEGGAGFLTPICVD